MQFSFKLRKTVFNSLFYLVGYNIHILAFVVKKPDQALDGMSCNGHYSKDKS